MYRFGFPKAVDSMEERTRRQVEVYGVASVMGFAGQTRGLLEAAATAQLGTARSAGREVEDCNQASRTGMVLEAFQLNLWGGKQSRMLAVNTKKPRVSMALVHSPVAAHWF